MIRFQFLFFLGFAAALGVSFSSASASAQEEAPEEPPPIRALMVTGGCCHDYETQKAILSAGIGERIDRRIEWVIVHQGQGESDVKIPVFEDVDWAEGYDIVVHNYCFTRVRDGDYIDRILAPHRAGKPAVLIHGTMHSFRTGNDKWFEFCGVTSPGHGSHHGFEVEPLITDNEIFGATDHWTTAKGELYFVDKVWPGAVPLAEAVSEDTGKKEVVAWTHRYGPKKARVFGTTIGNFNESMIEPNFLDMVAKGFLWAMDELGGENFIEKAPEDSLKSITLEPPTPGLPTPGRNPASNAMASAMSQEDDREFPAGAALDGNVSTQWRAGSPGPAAWSCSLEISEPVGAIALIWSEDPPPVYLVEGSNDLLDWRLLAELEEEGRAAQIAVHEAEGDFSHFRISVARTRPGQVVGLREFAVFGDMAEVPAALKLAAGSGVGRQEAAQLALVSSKNLPEEVELRNGMNVLGVAPLPTGFRAVQLVPTARGSIFVLAAAEDKSSAVVLLVTPGDGDEMEMTNFLTGLDPEATIGWDGEWIYTLENSSLTAYRDTDRNGMADERYRVGPIYVRSDKDSSSRILFSHMNLGLDGRFYAAVESAESVPVFGREGPMVELPEHGIVSFTKAGERLEVMLSTENGIDRLTADRHGGLYFQRRTLSNSPVLADIRVVASMADTGLGFSEGVPGEFLGIGPENRFWIADGDEISTFSNSSTAIRTAVFRGLERVEDSGLGRLWFTFREGKDGRESIGIFDTGAEKIDGLNMDLQRQGDLIELLESRSAVIRKEARYEVLRRRRFPQNQLMKVLSESSVPEARVAAMAALEEAAGKVFVPHLVKLARDPEPLVRAMAFRALGRHDGVRNHPVFGAITEETRPEVTAEILGAILRTETDAPGIDALVLQFAASDERLLVAAAREFLINRESIEVCFAALDDENKESLWPVAFSVLAEMERQSVVERIALLLEKTRSPKMRRLALKTLAEIYYRGESERVVWEGTKIADLMLRASVADHRVDRAFLLDQMLSRRIPVKDTAELVKLGSDNLPLEGVVIELLLDRDTPIYAEGWLLEVARDPDRDGDLRLKALALLGTIKSPPLLREIFPLLADRASLDALPETEIIAINRWIKNPAHLANVDWMVGLASAGGAEQGSLAWHTLLSVIDDPGLDSDAVDRLKTAMLATVAGSEDRAMVLLGALADSAYSGKEAILAKASQSENVLVKKTAFNLSAEAGRPSESDEELLSELEDDEIYGRIESLDGEEVQGKRVFSKLSCGGCHNIHGEGPALAPDLASRVNEQSMGELAEAILHPDKSVVAGYSATEFLLKDGIELLGHRETDVDESVVFLDTAGNQVVVPFAAIAGERSTESSIMPGKLTHDLTVKEFASLLRYLKSLSDEQ